MDNQHKKIKGYRDLTEEEVALMNEIKEHGEKTKTLLKKLSNIRTKNKRWLVGQNRGTSTELDLSQISTSFKNISTAEEYLQTGQMWLVRSVALPDSF